jgi:hypothetical protein
MKYLLLILLITLSCSKEKKTCWDCVITGGVGCPDEIEVVCNDGENPGGFKDCNGADASSFCQKR